MPEPVRIAMWSGPRNISTAMMRAFENRPDCAVLDEPFYAVYLDQTKSDHPGFEEVVASQPTNWRDVVVSLLAPVPGAAAIYYQKHMAHHMLPEIGHDWFGGFRHAFLIRDPEEIVASYVQKREGVAPEDLGLDVQVNLYKEVIDRTGNTPVVINAEDILKDPTAHLARLCESLEISFDHAMLSWPKGARTSDGVWAKYWYHAVEASTEFAPYVEKDLSLSHELQAVADTCRPAYEYLNERRLMP